jgi:integrase
MRKPWVYNRKNRPGWYVGWYDSTGKRRSKMLPNKSLADRFARRVEFQLNEDIYLNPVALEWDRLVREYLEHKQYVQSLASESLRSIANTLSQFKALHGPVLSTKLDQRLVNEFIAHRLKTARKPTVNKDIRNLRTFVRWATRNRYMGSQAVRIEWITQKEAKRPVKSLSPAQVSDLLIAASRHGEAWYVRVLLAVSSGLRRGDIERLKLSDIDFRAETISTFSQKTGKGMPDRPLHPVAVAALSRYVQGLPEGQGRLFLDKFTSGKWERIRKNAGLPNLKFHDLRRTFASLIAQAGFGSDVTQDLLEHSTGKLTHDVYVNVKPVYRKAIESIPIDDITEP